MTTVDQSVLQRLANSGNIAAAKAIKHGWSSLRTNQKAALRALGAATSMPVVVAPKRNRYIGGNPNNERRKTGPGNAAKRASFERSEPVGAIVKSESTVGFFTSYVINPRNVESFRQLFRDAVGFNKYRVNYFRVRYSPRGSDFTTGGVILAFTQDSSDKVPTNHYDLENLSCSVSTPARQGVLLTCPPRNLQFFLRDSQADDAKLVDYGRVIVCSYGQSTSDPTNIGELYFEYSITLLEPQYVTALVQHTSSTSNVPTGPSYASLAFTATAAIWTFAAPAHYLLVAEMTATTTAAATTSNATITTGTTVGDSDKRVIAVFELDVLERNATLTQPGTGITSVQWYVSLL